MDVPSHTTLKDLAKKAKNRSAWKEHVIAKFGESAKEKRADERRANLQTKIMTAQQPQQPNGGQWIGAGICEGLTCVLKVLFELRLAAPGPHSYTTHNMIIYFVN